MAMILKLSSIFGVELVATHPTAKTGKCFANNRARKTDIPADIQLEKEIGLCREISNLCKVSSL